MKLNNKGLENKNAWEAAGYALPQYDREAVAAKEQSRIRSGFISEPATFSVPSRQMWYRIF